jgi:hypothetical protein
MGRAAKKGGVLNPDGNSNDELDYDEFKVAGLSTLVEAVM